jgi:RimJ/RimL family protein N-acetyltransferase
MSRVRFRSLSRDDAAVIAQWRYLPPYDFYNHPCRDEEAAGELLRPEYNYNAIEDSTGRLIGYFCLGPDARVPGWDYDNSALDLGMGLDPALIGQGLGTTCLRAILVDLRTQKTKQAIRATVAEWNQRAFRLCHRAGFVEVATLTGTSGFRFRVLVM